MVNKERKALIDVSEREYPDNGQIGRNIRRILIVRGHKILDLIRKIGMNPKHRGNVYSMLNYDEFKNTPGRRRNFRIQLLMKIADTLDVELSELLINKKGGS